MKILQLNKYFYQKGGAETVFFQHNLNLGKQRTSSNTFCPKKQKKQIFRI